MNESIIKILRCPISGQALYQEDSAAPYLTSKDGRYRYPIEDGIAMLLAERAEEVAPQRLTHQP